VQEDISNSGEADLRQVTSGNSLSRFKDFWRNFSKSQKLQFLIVLALVLALPTLVSSVATKELLGLQAYIPNPKTSPVKYSTPIPLHKSGCGMKCQTTTNCPSGFTCYQPPMPTCPPGEMCAQVMPVKICRNPACQSSANCFCQTPVPTPTLAPVVNNEIFVIEDDGTMINTDGSINAANITKKFYGENKDLFDFLVIYTNYEQLQGSAEYAMSVKNDVKGIGLPISDYTSSYGSSGKLRLVVFMKSINFNDEKTNQPIYRTLAHEIGHTWSVYINNPLPSGTKINYGPHFWDGLQTLDKYDGLMQDNRIIDNGNGTYSAIHYFADHLSKFHPFALYLMGLESPNNIKDKYLLIRDLGHYTSDQYFENGIVVGSMETYTSPIEYVGINDLISAAGQARDPSFETSPKTFTMAYILVTTKGTQATDVQLKKLKFIHDTFPSKWYEATYGKSNIIQVK
jgi:hypothetical protein